VRGYLYACDWLEDAEYGTRVAVASRSRALWVPDAGLLFQWPLPKGTVQVAEQHSFPPPPDKARVAFLEDCAVPYTAVREARKHLERMCHVHAQRAVIQQATDLLTREEKASESRFQTALTKAGLRPQ
jgi:hypothetical protein